MKRVLLYPPASHARVLLAAIVFVAVLVHAGAIGHGFVFDDVGIIERNPLLHEWSGVWRAFLSPWWPRGAGQYRPLVLASFTAEWQLSGGTPMLFHALNIGWHAVATALVFTLARTWLSLAGAAAAGLLFAVHPVHVEAVANVVGRAELMATAGVLAAVLLHQRRSAWGIMAFAFALASKEHALVFLALALLADIAAPRRPEREREAEGRAPLPVLYGGYAVILALWVLAVLVVFGGSPVTAVDTLWQSIDAPARWLTMLGVVPLWVRLWFAPFDLSADYSPRVVLPWPENAVSAALGGALVVAVMLLGAVAWRRSGRVPVALAWIVLTVLPVANLVVPTGMIVAERTLYLSSVGAVMLFGGAMQYIGRRRAVVAVMLAGVVAVLFGARTLTRVPVWQSNKSLFLATVRDHPESSWAHVLLARVYASNQGHADALREYRIALELFDRASHTWVEAARSAMALHDLPLADSLLATGRRRLGDRFDLWAATADVALARRSPADAFAAAERAARLQPDSLRPHFLTFQAWLLLGSRDSAVAVASRLPAGSDYRSAADSLVQVFFPVPNPPDSAFALPPSTVR